MLTTRRTFVKNASATVIAITFLPRWKAKGAGNNPALTDQPPQIFLPNADVPIACRVERLTGPLNERFPFGPKMRVTRSLDLLDLVFEWTNVEPVPAKSKDGPHFIRKKPGDAFLTVWFPPQYVLEHTYSDPVDGHVRLPAQGDLPPLAVWNGATRLVFAIPEIYERKPLPYDLATLLNWQALIPSVAPNAIPPDYPVTSREEPQPLKISETAIELPWGLLLSPDAGEEWLHKEDKPIPILRDFKSRLPTKVELWHTELIRKAAPARPEVPLSVRAVWYKDDAAQEALPDVEQSKSIVHQTSNFNLNYIDGHKFIARHVNVERLLLSSQGAYARLKVGWNYNEIQKINHPPGIPLNILEWIHQSVWSREQYSKVSELGYCMPFGNVVSYEKEHRREFKDFEDGTPVARLEGYHFCTVRQPVIEYELPLDGGAGVGRGCCYQRIEISPDKTPYLKDSPEKTNGWMVLKDGDVNNEADIFKFKITAWDWDGNRSQFELPLAWVPKTPAEEGTNLAPLVAAYTASVNRRTATLSSQKVAFAPSDEKSSRDVGVETASIIFNVSREEGIFPQDWIPRFYPKVENAKVRLAQTAAFDTSGAGGRSILSYNSSYLTAGFRHTDLKGNVINGTEVFANITKEAQSETPSLTFPGDKSGGLTTPSLDDISNLSRVFGPVGGPKPGRGKLAKNNDESPFVKGHFNPNEFLGAAAKLVGGVDLAEVIEEVQEAYDEIARVPKLVAETIKEIQGEVEKVRQAVEDIRQVLDLLNAARNGDLKPLYDAIRRQVTELVEGEAEKIRTKLTQQILQEVRDYKGALRALETAAVTGFDTILTTGINSAAEKFSKYFSDLCKGADAFFPFIFTALRDAEHLKLIVEDALKTIDEYKKLKPAMQQQAVERIKNYLQSPEFSAALGAGQFQKQLENLRVNVLGPVITAVHAAVPNVGEEMLALAIEHPEVMAELVVAWDNPAHIQERIQEKVQSALTQLTADTRTKISNAVTKYFKDSYGLIETTLAKYNTSLLQFRDHILAEIKRLGLDEATAKKQMEFIKGILDPLKIRDAFEKALGSFDGVLEPVRGLPLGPLKNIIDDFNRLHEDFNDPAKNLLNGELNRTLTQLGQAIEDVVKPGLVNTTKTLLVETNDKLKNAAKAKLQKELTDQINGLINGLKVDPNQVAVEVSAQVETFLDKKRDELVEYATTYADAVIVLSEGWMDGSKDLLRSLVSVAAAITDQLQQVMDAVKYIQNLAREVENEIPKELAVDYAWEPKLKSSAAFEARRNAIPATFKLHARIRKSLLPGEIGKPPSVRVDGQLRDFSLRLLPSTCFVIVALKEVSFLSENGSKPKVVVKIDRVSFGQALEFVQELAKALSPDSGFFIQLFGLGLETGYRLALPNITSGGFNLVQISINTSVVLPFDGSEVRVKFSLCDRQRPFLLSVGVLGGGGFFGITLSSKGVETLEGSLEFGAVVALDICVATGIVSVTAGIYFCQSGDDASLFGFVRAAGSLRVIGFITMSVQFYLGIGYEKKDGKTLAVGEAVLTVEIEIGFFSVSVDLHYRKEFEGSSKGDQSRLTNNNRFLGGGGAPDSGLSDRARDYLAFKRNWRKYRSSFFDWRTTTNEPEKIAL